MNDWSSGSPQTVQAGFGGRYRAQASWQVLALVSLADGLDAVDIGADVGRPDVVVAQEPGQLPRVERLASQVTPRRLVQAR